MSCLPNVPQGGDIDLVYGGLSPRSIDSFDTLVECFNAQYATNRSHRMTLAALASLWQTYDKSLRKFMDIFGHTLVQIRNLNPEVALHSMFLALRPRKFTVYAKNPSVAWTSCVNEPKATSRWKKCQDSGTKSDKLDKSATSEKEAPRPTYISRTRGASQTSASLF